ncbi:hypothetical protein SESBI_35318 [Sesbania bispinosa]|nr:hypothetical protein SESBI_35318 [Sesbania bispinosa]
MPLLDIPSSYQEVTGGMSQFLLPSPHPGVNGEWSQLPLPHSHDEELLTSLLREVNMTNASGQEAEPFVQNQNTSNPENTALNEEMDPQIDNLLNSFWMSEQDHEELFVYPTLGETYGEGNTGMNEFAGFTSSAIREDDNESETRYSSNNL